MRTPIVVAALLLAACHDPPSHGRFAVTGSVFGLANGSTVTLLIDTQPAATLMNGPFTIPSAVLDGSDFSLGIGGISDADFICFFDGSTQTSGIVPGADLVVMLSCTSSNLHLKTLELSAGPVLEPDIPSAFSFHTAPIAVLGMFGDPAQTTITASAVNSSATVSVQGSQIFPGTPSFPITLAPGDNPLDVFLQLPSGLSGMATIHVPGVLELRTAADAPVADHQYGTVVAMGDLTLAVGSPGDGDGTVDVYARLGQTWNPIAHLAPTCVGCRFGAAVAMSNDGTRLVVGAPGEASGKGAAYVFVHLATWTEEAHLVATAPQANAALGTAVAIDEPGAVVAAGAPGATSGASGAGAVFVFGRGVSTTWAAQPTLAATAPHANDALGSSVAMSGTTIVAGAPGASSAAGAAIAFVASGATYVQQQVIVASNARAGAHFGAAVALDLDYLAVGAPDESSGSTVPSDTSMPGAGAAYQIVRSGALWSEVGYLKSQSPMAGARFGAAVTAESATETVICGVPNDAAVVAGGGGVVGFRSGSTFSLPVRRIAVPVANQHVGASVAYRSGVVAVGAPGEASNAGAIYSF